MAGCTPAVCGPKAPPAPGDRADIDRMVGEDAIRGGLVIPREDYRRLVARFRVGCFR